MYKMILVLIKVMFQSIPNANTLVWIVAAAIIVLKINEGLHGMVGY